MCGIGGIVYPNSSAPPDRNQVQAMLDVTAYRGPDDSGIYESPGVVFGSRRLAILDLSPLGHMPMRTPDGRYWIVYNGEVFNFRSLRAFLESKGYRFVSNSDTEVVLYLFAHEGAAMLSRLNGMFAIAIWDAQERTLLLARDRLGVKPVYYAEAGGRLYFASEQKALFAAGLPPVFDGQTWEELLCFRYTAGERTPFKGVRRLLPGHALTWRDGQSRITEWWNLAEKAREQRSNLPASPDDWFCDTFNDAVNLRQIADVPVGVLLSGGLDSSCVAAALGAQRLKDVASFTVRFQENHYDEGPQAACLAAKWKLDHHELFVRREELYELLLHCSWLNDEPLAQGNEIHLYAISKYAKRLVTVLLSGEGADETMGGYIRYQPLRYFSALAGSQALVGLARKVFADGASGSLGSRLAKLDKFLGLGRAEDMVLFNACEILPRELAAFGFKPGDHFEYRRKVNAEAQELYPGEPMRQAMHLDQYTFLSSILHRNDRMTMGASIECRVPFLDFRLLEGLAALPSSTLTRGFRRKPLLRNAFASALPREIRQYRKWGFGVPWDDYFKSCPELRQIVASLPDQPPISDGPFERGRVREVVDAYLNGNPQHHAFIRQLLFVAIWHRANIQQNPAFRPAK